MDLEENKNNAIAFYKTAYEGNPKAAIEQYIGKKYIQHNPDVADSTQGLIDYFERMQKEYPEKSVSTGILFNRSRKGQRIQIQCIEKHRLPPYNKGMFNNV